MFFVLDDRIRWTGTCLLLCILSVSTHAISSRLLSVPSGTDQSIE